MNPAAKIQSALDSTDDVRVADRAAHDLCVEAGVLASFCMVCRRVKDVQPSSFPALSHGLHEGACAAAYRARFGRRVA